MHRKWKKLIRKMAGICNKKADMSDLLTCYQKVPFNNLTVLRAFILSVYIDKRSNQRTYTIINDIVRLDTDHTHIIHSATYEILPNELRAQKKLITDICDIKNKTDEEFKAICDKFTIEDA